MESAGDFGGRRLGDAMAEAVVGEGADGGVAALDTHEFVPGVVAESFSVLFRRLWVLALKSSRVIPVL